MSCQVLFEPVGRSVAVSSGKTLLEAARMAGIHLESSCGGEGVCGKCIIQVIKGTISAPGKQEELLLDKKELEDNFRLACLTGVEDNLTVYIPPSSLLKKQKVSTKTKEKKVSLDPFFQKHVISVSDHKLHGKRSEELYLLDRCLQTISESPDFQGRQYPYFDISATKDFTRVFTGDYATITLYNKKEICSVEPGNTASSCLGVAVDVGTTKVACYLIDMVTGKTIGVLGFVNPQVQLGEDIITRMTVAIRDLSSTKKLQDLIISCLNEMLKSLCAQAGFKTTDIFEVVIVGNSVMHHLLLGLPLKNLAYYPYIPAYSSSLNIKARDIGLNISRGGYVYFPPLIASYIGSDHAAVLVSLDFSRDIDGVMWIDIGTNTEVTVVNGGKSFCCSCASGPALEGMHVKYGMRGAPGAVEKVEINRKGQVSYQTIDGEKPIGICGSGIVDLVAELKHRKIINSKGLLNRQFRGVRKAADKNYLEFVVVPEGEAGINEDIVFTQNDIGSIQLSKAAIATGIDIICQEARIAPKEIKKVYLAGSFGSFINPLSAVKIGMLPDLPLDRFIKVDNAAGEGAKVMLKSRQFREKVEVIIGELSYQELTTKEQFSGIYSKNLMFPGEKS